jgi:hypothetical protein
MNQLKSKNPQAFQFLEQARQNQNNPQELFKQITNGYTPEQMNMLFDKARQFGIDDNVINQLKQ